LEQEILPIQNLFFLRASMKFEKLALIVLSSAVVVLCLLRSFRTSDSILGHISSKIMNGNTIHLHFRHIEMSHVKITTVSEDHRILLFDKFRQVNPIEEDVYGPFRFEILLPSGITLTTGHWKKVCWGAHAYSIEVIKSNKGYNLTFEADGPDYTKIKCTYDAAGKAHGPYVSYYRNGKPELKWFYNHGTLKGG
jgi:hypothetical protein